MKSSRTLDAAGVLIGPVDLAEPVTWGPVRFWEQDGRVHFEVVLDVADRSAEEMHALLERVGPAVQAAGIVGKPHPAVLHERGERVRTS